MRTDPSVLRRAAVAPPGTCQKDRMLRPPVDFPSQHLHLNKTPGDSFMLKTGKWRVTRKEHDCPSVRDNLTCSYQLADIPVVSWDGAGKMDPNADTVIQMLSGVKVKTGHLRWTALITSEKTALQN